VEPVIVGPGLKTGMPIKYDNPREVGADRIVNAVAAYEKYKTALIVVDFGTATTFDYISRNGRLHGGAPSHRGSPSAAKRFSRRPRNCRRVEIFSRPASVIAKDTISSMNAGIIYGYAGLVDGIVNRMIRESGEDAKDYCHGGSGDPDFRGFRNDPCCGRIFDPARFDHPL
jgi:type III pantothenate kinase